MARKGTTFRTSGVVGNNQATSTLVASISPLSPGRYEIWGFAHHTLANGVRLVITGQSNQIVTSAPNENQEFGHFVVDLPQSANTILLELQTATGASDIASGTIYAESLTE